MGNRWLPILAVLLLLCLGLIGWVAATASGLERAAGRSRDEIAQLKDEVAQLKQAIGKCVDQLTSKGPPGPTPIISVGPKTQGGGVRAAWKVEGVEAQPGASMELRDDLFGAVHLFDVSVTGGEPRMVITKLTLRVKDADGNTKTILAQKTPAGAFSWSVNGIVPNHCDRDGSPTPLPDCANSFGLPSEFFGELVSIESVPAEAPSIKEARMQARS